MIVETMRHRRGHLSQWGGSLIWLTGTHKGGSTGRMRQTRESSQGDHFDTIDKDDGDGGEWNRR